MIKSLKFNGKYIIMGLCLSVIVLISMYKSTTLDFINESITYLPLFAIIFSIFMNLELYEYRMEELYYVSNIYKWRTFLIRIINVIAIELIIIILNVLIYLALFDLGFDYESEIGIYFVTTIISFIYFTSVTTFVCGIIKRKSGSLCIMSLFWIYWIINVTNDSILNPFIFVAIPSNYEGTIMMQLIISCVLFILSFLIERRGPLWPEISLKRYFSRTKQG